MQSSGPAQDVPATIVRLLGLKPCLNSDPNHAGPMQEGTETDWEHFCDDLLTVNEDTKQDNANMQARNIYNDPKTLIQFYLKTGPHADTHTNEKKHRVLYWTLTAEERDELGFRVRMGTWQSEKGGTPCCRT